MSNNAISPATANRGVVVQYQLVEEPSYGKLVPDSLLTDLNFDGKTGNPNTVNIAAPAYDLIQIGFSKLATEGWDAKTPENSGITVKRGEKPDLPSRAGKGMQMDWFIISGMPGAENRTTTIEFTRSQKAAKFLGPITGEVFVNVSEV